MRDEPGLHLVLRGGLQALLTPFVHALRERTDPFERWLVLVPGRDVEAWLRQEIAARLGVCMGLEFRTIRDGVYGLLDDSVGRAPLWTPAALTRVVLLAFASLEQSGTQEWSSIARLLGEVEPRPIPLSKAARARRRVALAEETARLLLAYDETHPELLAWLAGDDAHPPMHVAAPWQRAVYQKIEGLNAQLEPARRRWWPRARLDACNEAILPRCRVVSFGHSALTPLEEDALVRLSKRTLVTAYMNGLGEGAGVMDAPPTSLVARFGEAAASSQRRLRACAAAVDVTPAMTSLAPARTLPYLQRALCVDMPAAAAAPDDNSVQLLGCVGTTRAAEAVADAVVASLAEDETRQRRLSDVEVICANYEEEHTLVGDALAARGELPFSAVASDGGGRLGSLLERMFSLVEDDFSRQAVLDVLQHPCFRGLPDLDDPLSLLDEAGVYVGANGAAPTLSYLDGVPRFHFEQGLTRLLVGSLCEAEIPIGIDGETQHTVSLPFRQEGTLALHAWASSLIADLVAMESQLATGHQWATLLERFLDVYLSPQSVDDDRELMSLRRRVARLAILDDVVPSGVDGHLDRVTACSFVIDQGAGIRPSSGMLRSGGVSLVRLAHNRALPFAVVCVTGLTEGDFPRRDQSSPLDLRSACAVPAPSLRALDRLAFVETLLAAEERLVLTYDRLDAVKDAPRSPASVIAELREALPLSAFVEEDRITQPLAVYAAPPIAAPAAPPYTLTAARAQAALVLRETLLDALRKVPGHDEPHLSLRQYQEALPAGVQASLGLLRPVAATTSIEAGRTRQIDSYGLYRFVNDPVEATAEWNLGRKSWQFREDRRESITHEPLAGDPRFLEAIVRDAFENVICAAGRAEAHEALLLEQAHAALQVAERRGHLPVPFLLAADMVDKALNPALTSLRALRGAGLLSDAFCRPVLGPARRAAVGASLRAPLLLGRAERRVTLVHDGALLSAQRDTLLFDMGAMSGDIALAPERAALEVMVLVAAGFLEEGIVVRAVTPSLLRSPKKGPLTLRVPPRESALGYLDFLVDSLGEGLFPVRLPLAHFPAFSVMAAALEGDDGKKSEVYELYLRGLRRDWRDREPIVPEFSRGQGLLTHNRFALRDLRDIGAPTRDQLFAHYESVLLPLYRLVNP